MIEVPFKIVLMDYESDRVKYEDSHHHARQVSGRCSHTFSFLCDHYSKSLCPRGFSSEEKKEDQP